MINKDYDLVSFHNNKIQSSKINSFDINVINNVKNEIIKIVKSCDAVLMHECRNFSFFSGRDIDTFYKSKNKLLNFEEGECLLHQRDKGLYRFLINDKKSIGFMNLDIEDVNIYSNKTIDLNKKNIDTSFLCKETGLRHFNLEAIIFYKLIKYFKLGVVHSYEQLFKLKKILHSLDTNELNKILKLISKYLNSEQIWIEKLISSDFESFENNKIIKDFWINKRIKRQKARKVFAGDVKIKNLIFDKKFIYAFLFGRFAKWPKNHRPLPAIAIIGNDGAGKTTICDYLIKNFSKMDPVIFNMKSNKPLMKHTKYLRNKLKKILELSIVKRIYLIKIFISIFGQMVDLFDKYIKYKIGMAFSDAGYGVTIFERYVSDRLRGEFPNKKYKFLPLEQFFPFPDGFVYLDIQPNESINRKSSDNHSLDEMTSKRKNYLSLIKEFEEVKFIDSGPFEKNLREVKNYIFELGMKKRKTIKSNQLLKRCLWKKNRNRLIEMDKDNKQSDNFV